MGSSPKVRKGLIFIVKTDTKQCLLIRLKIHRGRFIYHYEERKMGGGREIEGVYESWKRPGPVEGTRESCVSTKS